MFVDEFTLMTTIIMPFLKDKWDDLDLVESPTSERDGRLSLEELTSARDKYLAAGDENAAGILNELILRFDPICKAFRDSSGGEEAVGGISREDISVYTQLWDPSYRKRDGMPSPEDWTGSMRYW